MAGRIEARLAELGITLPTPMAPIANYIPFVVSGSLVVISGQVPAADGKIAYTGKLGAVSVEQAQAAARLCLVNVVAQLRVACGGDLDRVVRAIRLGGFVAAPPEFTQHAVVMNGASAIWRWRSSATPAATRAAPSACPRYPATRPSRSRGCSRFPDRRRRILGFSADPPRPYHQTWPIVHRSSP
jgi:enamine deaminase RidA (YjgF/YER057c/UK114 family)